MKQSEHHQRSRGFEACNQKRVRVICSLRHREPGKRCSLRFLPVLFPELPHQPSKKRIVHRRTAFDIGTAALGSESPLCGASSEKL